MSNYSKKTKVFITGATGVMGYETLKEFSKYPDEFELRLLIRDNKTNRKKLQPILERIKVDVTYGDLRDAQKVKEAMGDSDYVLHIGGMVSPVADHFPELTMEVNVKGAVNIVKAILDRPDHDNVKAVYIGSVAQTAHRYEPHHWGRTGDPILAAQYDTYAISKIKAELVFAESGLKNWVSLRQSGILHKGLIFKGTDPISFHVPLRGVLEWATVEDSARLMVGVCRKGVPADFWNNFYNIGSGKEFRLTNYRFEQLLLKSLGCSEPEKCFDANWFATRNFHGEWYKDSDKLNDIVPFRENITVEDYFERMATKMPWWIKLTPLAPAFLIKAGMKGVARWQKSGTLNWLAGTDNEDRINSFFGSREEQKNIPSWKDFDLTPPSEKFEPLDYGFDQSKKIDEISVDELIHAANLRNMKCLSPDLKTINPDIPLEWECSEGHRFRMRPRTILAGGHWCPECECTPDAYDRLAQKNPFIAQVWYDSHKNTRS